MNSTDNQPIPPPPPPLFINNNRTATNNAQEKQKTANKTPEIEVREACKRLFGPRLNNLTCLVCFYNPLDTVIQNGPMCGLVAVQMAAEALKLPIPSLDDLLNLGRKQNYTVQGEMFSAENLAYLCERLISCEVQVMSGGLSPKTYLISSLIQGSVLLVPYDTDCNFEPCCKRGHKAHWAVVAGIALAFKEDLPNLNLTTSVRDNDVNNLYHGKSEDEEKILSYIGNSELYVLAKQGKSQHLRLWHYDALASSNSNLIEVDPAKALDPINYVIPPKGIEDGLCKKIILLSKIKRH